MKKVLIFCISDFGGHNKAANNLKEAFEFRCPDVEVSIINGFGYFYPKGEKIVNAVYSGVVKYFPKAWGGIYDKKGIIKNLTPIRKLVNFFAFGKFKKLLEEFKPDCIIATQAFPCGIAGDYKQKAGINTPLIAVVTDYHPHGFWIHPQVNKYVVACQQAKDTLIAQGVFDKDVKILGIPISVKFLNIMSKTQIAAQLGIDARKPTVLIMGGGGGLGPLEIIAQGLDALPYDFQIIVVCGNNKKLHKWFEANKKMFKKPVIFYGYIDFIHILMDFSDIIVTKAGGITISESLSKGLAIVIANSIPGQEELNVKYLTAYNAVIDADFHGGVVNSVKLLLEDKKRMYELKENAKENSIIDSSLRIVDLVMDEMS